MQKYFDINTQGLSIRCKLYYEKDPRKFRAVVIAAYGFGGNKDNHAVATFAERIISKYKGYGVVCFDWPAHGKDALDKFTIEGCMRYLDLVVNYVKEEMHAEIVFNYSASLGAYVTLRYLHERGSSPFQKIAFRCPAVGLYAVFRKHLTPADERELEKGKEISRGYTRKVKLSREFFEDLKTHDVSEYDYLDYADDILMIHGTKDEEVPISSVRQFSEDNVIDLIEVENADHPFSNPDYMDLAITKIIAFFAPPASVQ